jgi:DtxR family Mn-dependent transcriptional regulator
MSEPAVPILLPCHGGSRRGARADEVAAGLADRGLAEVVEDIEAIVAAARDGRPVVALDGCAASCQARLLDAAGVETLRALNLAAEQGGATVAQSASAEEIEAAATPHKRSRRAPAGSAGELSGRGSHTLDDYLLALDLLTSTVVECGALVDGPTVSAHVAHILGVSRPAAGEMLARLEEAGYVRRGAHKDLLLTLAGRAAADRALRKQRILECFAVDLLGYALDECYEQAREIASGFDVDAVERVWRALGEPAHCPHGWPLNSERARHESRGLVALGAVPPATPVVVERLDEASRDRLSVLLDSGLTPGTELDDVTVHVPAGMVAFVDGSGARRAISLELAAAVLVRP